MPYYEKQEDTSTRSASRAALRAWKGHGGLQAALSQYRSKNPGAVASLLEVLKERPAKGSTWVVKYNRAQYSDGSGYAGEGSWRFKASTREAAEKHISDKRFDDPKRQMIHWDTLIEVKPQAAKRSSKN